MSPYRKLFDKVLVRMDPERAHHGAAALIAAAGRAPLRPVVSAALTRTDGTPGGATRAWGRELAGPLGIAAGFDKDARMALGLAAMGFAFVEVGTVTARPQPGNERPRMFRFPQERAIVNRMGFNNEGAVAAAARLRRLRRTPAGKALVLGANIGKSKVTPASEAVGDYVFSARRLAPFVDYLVVNVSSPNTPGLRDLQASESLRPILDAVTQQAAYAAGRDVPVLVKIAPDLADADIDAVADLARELGLAGVSAVNTTIDHDHGAGGMSGPLLLERGLTVVSRLRRRLGVGPLIIGMGGISSATDVRAYLAAGADLTQAYTGFIYGGPTWPGRINREAAGPR
ncbi:quinone-dependent dihydroorotate dehydrogenase [Pseudactinotalea sp. HY158]|uniref:quinone-dependent dihydroorotate dehydrogenase n=1 Tax=Pseudactinotalea sp. HY158 TaxID=2654547 RepID=UPI00129C54C2|nr:quinone-dependent dihydroorotate dehydrogenase [Pseudactinotalea sp. HY158]QGH69485.1 quinone-dependent dihydroorotate dehydrogenase [Pseudactinotalea sp. HY158]